MKTLASAIALAFWSRFRSKAFELCLTHATRCDVLRGHEDFLEMLKAVRVQCASVALNRSVIDALPASFF